MNQWDGEKFAIFFEEEVKNVQNLIESNGTKQV